MMSEKNSTFYNGTEYVAEALTFMMFDGKYANNMWVIDIDEAVMLHKIEDPKNTTNITQNSDLVIGNIYQFQNWMGI